MRKLAIIIANTFLVLSCVHNSQKISLNDLTAIINSKLNNWHQMACKADSSFFDFIDTDGIYIGTATEEVWTKQEFVEFAMPYFRKGKAWDFKPYDRNIYFSDDMKAAWFNERLETWMGVCRGTGVLVFKNNEWKIKQYNLSVSVPNEKINEVILVITKEVL
ncbi:MAG: nuclear transport factor 2 family protein [Salinivirgaceae bacterium]|nr:nuclear transport factor 2 family protein [Salinivirgaceae bacterium]